MNTGLSPAASPARSVVSTAPVSWGRPSDTWAPSPESLHAANASFPLAMALVAATSALSQLAHGWRAGQYPRARRLAIGPTPSAQSPNTAPLLILWDIENCSVPAATTPWSVASSILGSLRSCGYAGPVVSLFAYGDFALMRPATRRQLQATGWRCIDVPSGRKDAADRALQLDLLMYAREVPPPACVLLISGDRDFAPSMHRLSQLNYTTLLAAPVATASVAKELTSSASRVFDWASLACGLVVFEEKARTESRAEDNSDKSSGEAAAGGGGASRLSARSRAQDVSAFVAAASEAIEAEDVGALQEVVASAQAAGLRVTREQEALTELRRKLKRRELHVAQARSRLHDALAQGNAMLCEAALLNARAQGVAQFLQPEVDAATAVVRASRGDEDDDEDEDEDDDRQRDGRRPRAGSGRVLAPGGDGSTDDPMLVLAQLKNAGEAAAPEWFRKLLTVGATECDLGMLQYALDRATECGLDASPAAQLLAAVSRARSLAGALQKAALVRDASTLAGLLGMRSSSTIMLHSLMPAEHSEAWAALETLRQQAQDSGEAPSRGRAAAEEQDDLSQVESAEAAALRERVAAAVDAEDGPVLRAALMDGALRLRIPAGEGDIRRLKVSMAARECISDLHRAAEHSAHCPHLLRSRILRAQRDYITRYPTRTFPKTDGGLLASLQVALEYAQEVEALLPRDDDATTEEAEAHEEASALAR